MIERAELDISYVCYDYDIPGDSVCPYLLNGDKTSYCLHPKRSSAISICFCLHKKEIFQLNFFNLKEVSK